MKPKHTPGPWQGESLPFVITTQERIQVALVSYYGDKEESRANVNLIAAAPELLEACIMTYNMLVEKSDDKIALTKKLQEIETKLYFLIPKAQGI